MENNNQQNIDIAILKEKVSKIEERLDMYETNHFPSIERRFDVLEKKLAYWGGGLGASLAILQIVLSFFGK